MGKRIKAWWQGLVSHPVFQLEWRRIQRQPWGPKKRGVIIATVAGCAPGCFILLMLIVVSGGIIVAVAVDATQKEELVDAFVAAVMAIASVGCLLGLARTLVELAVLWVAPAVAAMSIVREREMGTFDLLRTTTLSESSIVLGKLFGSLAWMWPGLLALAILTPVQLVSTFGTSLVNPFTLIVLGSATGQMTDNIWLLVRILVLGLIGTMRPWVDLVLHTTIGLFMSTVFGSPGAAIAATYGAIIVTRGILWVLFSAGSSTLALLAETAMGADPVAGMMAMLQAGGLARILIELGAAAILVWASVWQLRRK